MLADYTEVHRWIAWVPIVAPLVACALVFRRMPLIPLMIVGGLAGLGLGALAPAVGLEDDWTTVQLFASLSGLAVGSVAGVEVGDRLRRRGPRDPDGSLVTVGLAIGLGLAGLLIGGLIPALRRGEPPDLDLDVIVASAIGGGIGWAVGATIGWRRTRGRPPPTTLQRVLLGVMAAAIVLFGVAAANEIRGARFGPAIDDVRPRNPRLPPIAALVIADAALGGLTLAALAARRGTRPREA